MKASVLLSSSRHAEWLLVYCPFNSPVCLSATLVLLHLSLAPPKLIPWLLQSLQCLPSPILGLVGRTPYYASLPVLPRMWLSSRWTKNSSYLRAWMYAALLTEITCLSWTTSRVESPSRISLAALTSRVGTGPLWRFVPRIAPWWIPLVIDEEIVDKSVEDLNGDIHEAWYTLLFFLHSIQSVLQL